VERIDQCGAGVAGATGGSMDLTSTLFLAVFCMLGGVIAFFADRLGRTLGKKRLRLLRLRPRHTAEFITVVAGVLIPAVTIALIMGLSSDVRKWITMGNRAIAEAEMRQAELESLTKERNKIAGEVRGLDQRLKESEKRLAASEENVRTIQAQAAEFERQAAAGRERVNTLDASIRALQTKIRDSAKELASMQEARDAADKQRVAALTSYRELKRQSDELTDEYNRLLIENERLTGDIGQMQKTLQSLQSAKQTLEGEVSVANRDLESAKQALDDTQRRLSETDARLREAESGLQEILSIAQSSRMQPLIFARGEELVRLEVDANLTAERASIELTRLVRSARFEAERQGAKATGRVPSAGIMERVDPGAGRIITAEEIMQDLARRLSGLDEPMIVIAYARLNAFRGEPVSIDVAWYRNPVVFRSGEMIAEAQIDGREPLGKILSQISQLLQSGVRERALAAGMVPAAGKDQAFGSVSSDVILDLVDRIRNGDRVVRLQAFARTDTRAGDQLDLDFRIR
jgi:uncharacterized protein (DUF3084 family)